MNGSPNDTPSATYRAEPSHRERMQRGLMEVAVWLSEHPEAKKNLKPIRSAEILKPGVYFNVGTGMVDRVHAPQRVALGHRLYRISKDPSAPAEEIKRTAMEGDNWLPGF